MSWKLSSLGFCLIGSLHPCCKSTHFSHPESWIFANWCLIIFLVSPSSRICSSNVSARSNILTILFQKEKDITLSFGGWSNGIPSRWIPKHNHAPACWILSTPQETYYLCIELYLYFVIKSIVVIFVYSLGWWIEFSCISEHIWCESLYEVSAH